MAAPSALFEILPNEILQDIIQKVALNSTVGRNARPNADLVNLLRVNRKLYANSVQTIMEHVKFPYTRTFAKFLSQIAAYPVLGEQVKTLDLSAFSPMGSGMSESARQGIQNLTIDTLYRCLTLTPNLRTLLLTEHVQNDIGLHSLETIFYGLEKLEAVDFQSANSKQFVDNFSRVVSNDNLHLPAELNIRRLGLYQCSTIPVKTLDCLLPRLTRLTHLDLTATRVSLASLNKIPHSAKLTHLSLAKCMSLEPHGEKVVDFLVNHPAARSLVYLNLNYNPRTGRLLAAENLDELLPKLPTTLRSLNIYGSGVNSSHVPMLKRLCSHLEELFIGYADLRLDDINELVEDPSFQLKYLDVTGVSSITPGVLLNTRDCALLREGSPIRVLEVQKKVWETLQIRRPRPGWKVDPGQGDRGYYVHTGDKDDGERSWKMGERRWGSMKVACGNGPLTALYKHAAFDRV